MAEILLSLTIIGVVAAITLPSLTGNINERTWNTQRKALYARISQAIALMPSLNSYGTVDATTDTAAETFITEGLAKVLKINNICDNEHLADCGITAELTTVGGRKTSMPNTLEQLNSELTNISYASGSGYNAYFSQYNTKSAAFETQNGESINLFYNKNCISQLYSSGQNQVQPQLCVNMIYDLNGAKGPNTVGKDIGFISVIHPTDSIVVAPLPFHRDLDGTFDHNAAVKGCTNFDPNYRLPNFYELISIFANKNLIETNNSEFSSSTQYWSSTAQSAKYYWTMLFAGGTSWPHSDNISIRVRCIKR